MEVEKRTRIKIGKREAEEDEEQTRRMRSSVKVGDRCAYT